MDSERKKRKLEDEDDSEETEMEKFFALVRSTKDIRDQLRKSTDRTPKKEEDKKIDQDTPPGIWKPTFEPEDFMEVGKLRKGQWGQSSIHAGPSEQTQEAAEGAALPATSTEDREVRESDSLDLKLSL